MASSLARRGLVALGMLMLLATPDQAAQALTIAPPGAPPGDGGGTDGGTLEPAPEPEPEPPPTWRFRHADKPVKVVVLAGSVGAWQRDPYAQHFENWCSNVEVENLSITGYGAFQLRQRFMDQVVANGYVNLRDPASEYWLVFQGGLNSVAMPEKTNKEIRQLFMSAHQRNMKVVALSLTPWGEESDSKRWKGLEGLTYQRYTQKIVDFELGRLTPEQALGRYLDARDQPDAAWDPAELADIGVDLYDSALRDRDAPLREIEPLRRELERSKAWKQRFAELDETTRELALDEFAQRAAELPRWFMRKELHSFDDIHPNEHGHRLIAQIACPQLPSSWGCSCPAVGADVPAGAE
ncbi:SGNH/GDSL hydrolase family protein [Enhygromyxa salina]|nr:SGNH/GDSL hydrolase family protein [Enhygromyxa salina]